MGDYRIFQNDAVQVVAKLPLADCVLTDPPYPNNAGYFIEGIEAARFVLSTYECARWFVFWDEMEIPPVPLPLVARHIWHRSNTNRPDNYEAIYEFNADGVKRASRVFSAPVIYPGLTGCAEAEGHPTQKNTRMIRDLMDRCGVSGMVLDPFMGTGTTGVACVISGRCFVGVEKDRDYFQIAKRRLRDAIAQPKLFAPPPPQAEQLAFDLSNG